MNVPQIIIKKRNGEALTGDEIKAVIAGFTDGSIPRYQMSAFLMAVFFRGMDEGELDAWTDAMIASGSVLDPGALNGPKIDKHSTGGVGDKVSISLAPIAAACGIYVPMISGRGLGHTGGTLDKLESFGMNVSLDEGTFRKVLEKTGLVFAGQTKDVCPADRKLYALRDVTGTVESVPLIASSIMSKKLAEGIDGLVLDIKVGRGAFMKDKETAELLAGKMKRIGEGRGVKVTVVLTAMDQPLGRACGNGIEAAEAVEMLQGKGPADYREVVLNLAARMAVLGGKAGDIGGGIELCTRKVENGEALERLKQVVEAQGGDAGAVDDPGKLPVGKHSAEIPAWKKGRVRRLNALGIGLACVSLGAGREKAEDEVDPGAGVFLHKKEGEEVEEGETLATLYSSERGRLDDALEAARGAYEIAEGAVEREEKIVLGEI